MYVHYFQKESFYNRVLIRLLRKESHTRRYVYLVSWFKFGLLMDEKTYILLYSLYPPVLLDGSVMLYTIVSRIVNLRDPKFDPPHGSRYGQNIFIKVGIKTQWSYPHNQKNMKESNN